MHFAIHVVGRHLPELCSAQDLSVHLDKLGELFAGNTILKFNVDMITLTSPLPGKKSSVFIESMVVINVCLRRCVIRKILLSQTTEFLLIICCSKSFRRHPPPVAAIWERSLVANTHFGRELIKALRFTSEMCWESPCPSAGAQSQQRAIPCSHIMLDVKGGVFIVSVHPWWLMSYDKSASSHEAINPKDRNLQLNKAQYKGQLQRQELTVSYIITSNCV